MKRKTIRNHRDFLTVRDAPWVGDAFFGVKIKPAKIPGDARYGIVVYKKVFKLAVLRNRAKRIVRDWIAYNEHLMMDKFDYIFILREPVLTLTRDEGRKKMQNKLKKLSKIYSDEAKK